MEGRWQEVRGGEEGRRGEERREEERERCAAPAWNRLGCSRRGGLPFPGLGLALLLLHFRRFAPSAWGREEGVRDSSLEVTALINGGGLVARREALALVVHLAPVDQLPEQLRIWGRCEVGCGCGCG